MDFRWDQGFITECAVSDFRTCQQPFLPVAVTEVQVLGQQQAYYKLWLGEPLRAFGMRVA